MAKTREEKKRIVDELKRLLVKYKAVLLFDLSNFKTKQLIDFKSNLRKNNLEFKVLKKKLFVVAQRKTNIPFSEKILEIRTPFAGIFSFDDILASKLLYKFLKEEDKEDKILGAIIKNQNSQFEFLNREKIIELAKLPTRTELYQRFVFSLKNLQFRLINSLNWNIKGLLYILSNLNK